MTQPTQGPTEAVAEAMDDACQVALIGKTEVRYRDIAMPFIEALKARGYIVTREYQE